MPCEELALCVTGFEGVEVLEGWFFGGEDLCEASGGVGGGAEEGGGEGGLVGEDYFVKGGVYEAELGYRDGVGEGENGEKEFEGEGRERAAAGRRQWVVSGEGGFGRGGAESR